MGDTGSGRVSETYISVDVEATGPIPGDYSMISLGAAAFVGEGRVVTWHANLEELPGSKRSTLTMDWWKKQDPSCWYMATVDARDPALVVEEFVSWVSSFERPVLVAAPAAFDITFVRWYVFHFLGEAARFFPCVDARSYSMGMDASEHAATRKWRKRFASGHKHTHVAVEDAVEQGASFMKMVRYTR